MTVEESNPTSHPLSNEEVAGHLHGQGKKRVIAEWNGIKMVAEAEYSAFTDPITPAHYNAAAITTFDVVQAWKLDFFLGNTIKYIQRHEHKGKALEDLRKGAYYLAEKIKQLEQAE